jgi:hypothetical protein
LKPASVRRLACRREGATAAPIRIPLEVHAITIVVSESQVVETPIRVGPRTEIRRQRVTTRREIPPRQDRPGFDQALLCSNDVLRQADIQFHVQSFDTATAEIPGGRDRVDTNGFIYLVGRFPAQSGVSVLRVKDFERSHLGGEAIEAKSACIVCALGHPGTGKVLAHELAHLLGLQHVPRDASRAAWNLMYEALRAGDELTPAQISPARASRIAQSAGVR